MTQTGWDVEHALRIGRAIKLIRGERSAQWLSDQTGVAGHKVSRSTIADIENGRRKYVSTAELSVLAWSLGVPPVVLLYPDLPDGEVDLVPDRRASSIDAVQWFSGEKLLDSSGDEVETVLVETGHEGEYAARTVTRPEAGRRLVRLARERALAEVMVRGLSRTAAFRRKQGDADRVASLTERIEMHETRIASINSELKSIRGAVVSGSDGG